MFCEACTNLVLVVSAQSKEVSASNEELTGTLEHHASYNDFNEALSIGCRICAKVHEDGITDGLDDEQKASFKLTCDWSVSQDAKTGISIHIGFRSVQDDWSHWDLVPVEPSEGILAITTAWFFILILV